MPWPVFSDSSPNENYTFVIKPGDNRPVRVLIVVGLLFIVAFFMGVFPARKPGRYGLIRPVDGISVV